MHYKGLTKKLISFPRYLKYNKEFLPTFMLTLSQVLKYLIMLYMHIIINLLISLLNSIIFPFKNDDNLYKIFKIYKK